MRNIPTAEKENQRVTSDWDPILDLIDGVKVREVKNVMSDHSYVTEYFRQEWEFCERPVEHILQVTLCPGAITARHMHKRENPISLDTYNRINLPVDG